MSKVAFDACADDYDQYAAIMQFIGQQIIERLSYIKLNPSLVLDLGCGTGTLTHALAERYPLAKVIGLDHSSKMLSKAKPATNIDYQLASLEQLPFEEASVDLAVANVVLPFVQDREQSLLEMKRVLKPGGLLMFSSLGIGSFDAFPDEMKAALMGNFMDMHHLGDQLLNVGFSDPVVDMRPLTVKYASLFQLVNEFQKVGILDRSLVVEDDHSAIDIELEVVQGQAWGSLSDTSPDGNGDQTFPLKWFKKS